MTVSKKLLLLNILIKVKTVITVHQAYSQSMLCCHSVYLFSVNTFLGTPSII